MRNTLITFAAILLFVSTCIAQRGKSPDGKANKQVSISGMIVDQATQLPMEFATVSVLSIIDSSIISGSLTDIDGLFELQLPNGEYLIKSEFISYKALLSENVVIDGSKKSIDLGTIELSPESNFLNDIEIVSERSETTFALDKRVFTVGKDLANRGGSAEDILDNVPSITVDIEGTVSLRGSEGVRILINGRPSGLAGLGNTNGLRNIPANLIERVEVITNPSSRYEAEGMAGIINIILKKNDGSGFNGSFDLTTGYPETLGGSANVNYRKGKLNWFLNYGVNYREAPGGGFRIQDQALTDSLASDMRLLSFQDRQQDRRSLSNSIRFGADYFLTDKEQLTAAFLYRRSDEDNLTTIRYEDFLGSQNLFTTDPLYLRSIDDLKNIGLSDFESDDNPLFNIDERTDIEEENEKNLEYSLNYRKEFDAREHTLNAIVQFTEKSEIESSQFITENLFNIDPANIVPNQISNNDEGETTWLFQLDYVHPLGKDHKYELGLRSSIRQITNDFLVEEENNQTFFVVDGLSNNFIYDEDVHAAYAIYGNTFGKFNYQLGLRTELSRIRTRLLQTSDGGENDRTYNDLFPSGFLSYNFNEASAMQVSYSRRINRPRFWDLNPFFTFSDNRNFFSGNPNLNPEYTDSYEIGQLKYWDDVSINSSLYLRNTNAARQRILVIDNINSTTLRLPVNVGQEIDMGLDVSGSYSGIKWLRLDANVNVYRNQVKLNQDDVTSEVFENFRIIRNFTEDLSTFQEQFNVSVSETDNITWNGRLTSRFTFWGSDLQLRMNYRGARESTQGAQNAIASVDVGWSKDFLNKSLTLTLSVRDLLNSRKRNSVSLFDEFADRSEFQWRSRVTTITASYRINQNGKKGNGNKRANEENGGF
ncbi:TonB-dependent receptor family protein [Saprospiraceae bacterium]|nr:TonB-dependent receptor family protein [Saprospiraceae bacterium]